MFLGKREIAKLISEGRLGITPLRDATITNAGLDLSLGGEYCVIVAEEVDVSRRVNSAMVYECHKGDKILIPSRSRVLAHTMEYIEMPDDVIGLVGIRSSFARLGLAVPFTIVDPGFQGELTIEIVGSTADVLVPVGEPFVHLVLARVEGAVPYEGVYKGQRGVRFSKYVG